VPLFAYRAMTVSGKIEKGSINAVTEREARDLLRSRAIYPLDVQPAKSGGFSLRGMLRLGGRPRISNKDLAAFSRQLATLLDATIPYDTALGMIQSETANAELKRVLEGTRARVVEGAFLADAFGASNGYFPPMVLNMVRSGETSNTLVTVLSRLADYYENVTRLQTKIMGALVYPAFMLVLAVAVVSYILVGVMPQVEGMYTNLGGVLPLPTRMLLAMSDMVEAYWWLLLGGAAGLIWLTLWFFRTERGQTLKDRVELALPLWRTFRRKVIMHRLAQTLSTMLASGVELHDALLISAEVVENRVYAKALNEVIFNIRNRGMQLAAALGRSGLFPQDICQMVAVGEETATLDQMLENVSRRLSQEVSTATDAAVALFEPVMILFMGVIIGFIAISILLPMLTLSTLMR